MENITAGQALMFGFVEMFRSGARICDAAYEIDDRPIQRKGLKIMKTAADLLDTSFKAKRRDALARLLDDSDPGVRVYAAGYLVGIMPERALAVLNEVRNTCLARTNVTAARMIQWHEAGDLNL